MNSPSIDLAGATDMTMEAWVLNPDATITESGGILAKHGYDNGYRVAVGYSQGPGSTSRYWAQVPDEANDNLDSASKWRSGDWQHVQEAACFRWGV